VNAATASETLIGAVELATAAEAVAGTSTSTVVTPAGLKAALDVAAPNLVDSQGNALAADACVLTCPTTAGTAGQVLTAQADGSTLWTTPASGGLTAVSHDATLTGDGNTTPLSVTQATEAQRGAVELATTTEAAAGTSTTLAVTPAGLAAAVPAATETVAGKVELATTTEAAAGTSTTLAVTPAGVAAYVASAVTGAETKVTAGTHVTVTGTGTTASPYVVNAATASETLIGAVELATTTEAAAGTSTTLAVTPAGVAAAINGAFTDCSGNPIAKGTTLATCANLTAAVPSGGTDGQVLTKQADGTNAWETPASGSTSTLPISIKGSIETSGTYTVPAGVSKIVVQVVGASFAPYGQNLGSGGGGRGYAEKVISVTPGQTFPYVIGALGGTTTFDTISIAPPQPSSTTTRGIGGVATGGNFNANGGSGGLNNAAGTRGGGGGSGSRAGSGGNGGDASATAPGGGGGTGGNNASGQTGGAAATAEAAGVYPFLQIGPPTFKAGQSVVGSPIGGAAPTETFVYPNFLTMEDGSDIFPNGGAGLSIFEFA
jgi:hypothetical protein